MNDLEVTLAAVRVLHDQATPNLDARKLALHVLGEFVRHHTPAAVQSGARPVEIGAVAVDQPAFVISPGVVPALRRDWWHDVPRSDPVDYGNV